MTSYRMSLIRHRKRTFFVVQRDWNAKMGRDACGNWQGISGPFFNDDTNKRGLKTSGVCHLIDLVLADTFNHQKASRRWNWHSPNGQHHNQFDYILVRKRFRSGVNSARTWSFPGAEIGSDHDLLMMAFHLRLKWISKQKYTTLKSEAERSQCVGILPSHDRRKVCTSHHHEQWKYKHGFNDHNLQQTQRLKRLVISLADIAWKTG